MNVLFICNTPFQIITAVNIILSEFKHPAFSVDLAVTDQFGGHMKIAENLRKTDFINNIFTAEVRKGCREKFKNLFQILFNRKRLYKRFDLLPSYRYDQLFIYNLDLTSTVIFERLKKENAALTVHRFEEGYAGYYHSFRQNKTCLFYEGVQRFRELPVLSACLSDYWFYRPELLDKCYADKKINRIPLLTRQNEFLVNIYNGIFGFEPARLTKYPEKYIFFEESYHINGHPIHDYKLVECISNIVGKDNLVIRLHPRCSENRFIKLGCRTVRPEGIPWEVVQLNADFTDKVFLTVSSGSVLASKLFFNDEVRTIVLYKCLNDKIKNIGVFDHFLNMLIDKSESDDFYLPLDIMELEDILLHDKCESYS